MSSASDTNDVALHEYQLSAGLHKVACGHPTMESEGQQETLGTGANEEYSMRERALQEDGEKKTSRSGY
jgi:hypothetical protein